MPYEQTQILAFKGLNANLRPELIDDAEAQDILNLRHDKLGYLVNRNGTTGTTPIVIGYTERFAMGFYGLSEFVLTSPWSATTTDSSPPYDDGVTYYSENDPTDRFMVYACRTATPVSGGAGPAVQYKGAYLMCPLIGGSTYWRDMMFFAPNGVAGSFEYGKFTYWNPNHQYETELRAPTRWLEAHNDFTDGDDPKDQNWIEHYASMNQYRNVMVLSDRANKDMLLLDDYNEAAVGEDQKHYFRLRENALGTFDINKVSVDYGLSGGQHNGDGVESGMALYQLYMQEKNGHGTQDFYTQHYVGKSRSPQLERGPLNAGEAIAGNQTGGMRQYVMPPALENAFLSYEHIANDDDEPEYWISTLAIRTTNKYVFSNLKESTVVNDALGDLTFINPDNTDEQAQAADAYIWDGHKIKYYPCTGIDTGSYYLRYKDLLYDKLTPVTPRLTKLKTKAGKDQEVPMGVWGYRFVWDYGTGEYSAPSAPLLVPDILWSAIGNTNLALSQASYERPNAETNILERQPFDVTAADVVFLNEDAANTALKVFNSSGALTPYGQLFYDAKQAVLETTHKYMPTSGSWSAENIAKKSKLVVTTTCYFDSEIATCEGTVLEGAYSYVLGLGNQTTDHDEVEFQLYKPVATPLTVPLFAKRNATTDTEEATYNSVFTDAGVYRGVYQNKTGITGYDGNVPSYQIVFEGANSIGTAGEDNPATVNGHIVRDQMRVMFNVVPLQRNDPDAAPIDSNNKVDTFSYGGTPLEYFRPPTLLRAVRTEADRLLKTKTDVPAAALSRLFVQGMAELMLCDHGYEGTWLSTYNSVAGTGTMLDHDTDRTFTTKNTWHFGNANTPQAASVPLNGGNIEFTNLRVVLYAKAERLTLAEQLTAFFPSSALWSAPRVKITIDSADIPSRARKLLIFRSRSVLANDWQAAEYGLVKTIDVNPSVDIAFLDDVKMEDVDYSNIPDEYAGRTDALKSRFNLALNERVYYSNFVEAYRPVSPRGTDAQAVDSANHIAPAYMDETWTYATFDTGTTTNLTGQHVRYILAYQDAAGYLSGPAVTGAINMATITQPDANADVTVLSCVPGVYDGSLQNALVIRAISGSTIASNVSNVASPTVGHVYLVESGTATYESVVYRAGETFKVTAITTITVSGSVLNLSQVTWYRIGNLEDGDAGVFFDNGLSNGEAINPRRFLPYVETMESGLRWSEPYQPNWVKQGSYMEVRAGDGDQITGIAQLYGNLVVMKERSMHRLAVQAQGTPISRVDEISNNIGCIAPNTLVNINNELYFLSWSGFYKYNNNVLEKADGAFGEELMIRLRHAQGGVRNPAIRDASCAYNSVYRELYLNIPIYTTASPAFELQDNLGNRLVRGHIYVLNLDYGLVTKFAYEDDNYVTNPALPDYGENREPRVMGRIYHHNSLGELRSADILPVRYYAPTPANSLRSMVHKESPTAEVDYDAVRIYASSDGASQVLDGPDIHTLWKSKDYTGNDKSIIKRIRKVFAFFQKGSSITITGQTHTSPEGTTNAAANSTWTKSYSGTQGEFLAVPDEGNTSTYAAKERGERYSITLQSLGGTQIEYFKTYWKSINKYER